MWQMLAGMLMDRSKKNQEDMAARDQAEKQQMADTNSLVSQKRLAREQTAAQIGPRTNGNVSVQALLDGVFTKRPQAPAGGGIDWSRYGA
jgi:hypothetical protein